MTTTRRVDNRGNGAVPFGYVYFDRTRVGFDPDSGVWGTRPEGYWPSPTDKEFAEAWHALQYEPWGHKIPKTIAGGREIPGVEGA